MIKIVLFPIKLALAFFFLILIFKSCSKCCSGKDPVLTNNVSHHSYRYIYDDKDCQIEIKDGNVTVHGCKKESNSGKKINKADVSVKK